MNSYWEKRFKRHFQLGSFIISSYQIKTIVENELSIKYKGNVEEYDRDKFEEEYNHLFGIYKLKFNTQEKNNYSRNTWYRLMEKGSL